MPQDATCPKCKNSFPVTEARNAFTVSCPKCDAEMTVEFKKPATAPEAGQPPYDLLVKPGALATAPSPPPKKKKDDDDDEAKRKGGSAAIVMLSAGFGMMFVLGGLGLTTWFLFFFIDTTPGVLASNSPNNPLNNQPNNNQPNNQNKGNNNPPGTPNPRPNPNPGPVTPPKPKDEFELKPVAGTHQAITPPPLDLSTSQVITLPAPAGAVSVGGNGRYIVMHIPSKNQLMCFDASQGKTFVSAEPTNPGPFLLAAGQNRMATLTANNVLSVYDLPSLQRKYDASGPQLVHPTASLAMGSATNGPLLACNPFGDVVLIDVGANSAMPIEGSKGNIGGDMGAPVRAAANGKLFVRGAYDAGTKTVFAAESGRKWKSTSTELSDAYPSPDAKNVFGYSMITYSYNGGIVGQRAATNVWYVPGVSGTHFLKLTETKDGSNKSVVTAAVHKSHTAPEREKVTPIALPEAEGLVDSVTFRSAPLDQHLFLIPEARMLVVLNVKKDKLTMRKVDIK